MVKFYNRIEKGKFRLTFFVHQSNFLTVMIVLTILKPNKGVWKMKILVTGGSGFVGKEVIRQALMQGHTVAYLSRHEGQGKLFENPMVTHIKVDLVKNQKMTLPNNYDVIVHLVGAIKPNDIQLLNVQAMRGVIKLAVENQIEQLIYLSARVGYPAYLKSKQEAEELLKASGLTYGILQSGLIYGTERPLASIIGQISRYCNQLPLLGKLVTVLSPIPVQEIAQVLLEKVKTKPASFTEKLIPLYIKKNSL